MHVIRALSDDPGSSLCVWKYDIFARIFSLLLRLFYREVEVWGIQDIPQEDAVIFVAGPHSNDVADTGLLMPSILSRFKRRVSFLVGARTMGKSTEGFLARGIGATVLNRDWDRAKFGAGTISILDPERSYIIRGHGTRFHTEAQPGDRIMCVVQKQHILRGTIAEICGPEILVLTQPLAAGREFPEQVDSDYLNDLKYSFVSGPRLRSPWDGIVAALRQNRSLSLFPEGTCHDQPRLLPLKTGFSVVAFKYLAAYPGQRLRIVPCAIHHQESHLFRSRIGLEFGAPINVPQDLIKEFNAGDEMCAVSALKLLVESALLTMTACGPISGAHDTIRMAIDLAQPKSIQDTCRLRRRILRLHTEPSSPEVRRLLSRVNQYRQNLMSLGLDNWLIHRTGSLPLWFSLLIQLLQLAVAAPFLLIGLLLFGPLLSASSKVAHSHAKRATAASAFRHRGHDVLASAKVLGALRLAPLLYGAFVGGICRLVSWTNPNLRIGALILAGVVVFVLLLISWLGIIALFAWDVAVDAAQQIQVVVTLLLLDREMATKVEELVGEQHVLRDKLWLYLAKSNAV